MSNKSDNIDKLLDEITKKECREFLYHFSGHTLNRKMEEYGLSISGQRCQKLSATQYPPVLHSDMVSLPPAIKILKDLADVLTLHNSKVNKERLFDLPFEDFIYIAKNRKNCGKMLERYFMRDFKRIAAAEECGDYLIHKNGKTLVKTPVSSGEQFKSLPFAVQHRGRTVEVKTSMLDHYKRGASINYIRPWQTVAYYYIFIIDCANENRLYFFRLTEKQIEFELDVMNGSAMNNTEKSNRNNREVPLKISLPCKENNIDFKRWLAQYYRKWQ